MPGKFAARAKPAISLTEETRRTVDGKEVLIIGEQEIKFLSGRAVCAGGRAFGFKQTSGTHRFRTPKTYDDWSRGLIGIHIEKDEAARAYRCRKCQTFMGCWTCAGDIATLICNQCEDWANDISERVHGRMVKDPELARECWKIVDMRRSGQIGDDDIVPMFKNIFSAKWEQA